MSWFSSGSATEVTTTVSSWFSQYVTPNVPTVVNNLAKTVYEEVQSSVFLPAASAVLVPYTAYAAIRCFKYGDRAAGLHLLASSALLTGFAATKPYKEVATVAGGIAAVYLTGWFVAASCFTPRYNREDWVVDSIKQYTKEVVTELAEATKDVIARAKVSHIWDCVACGRGTDQPLPWIQCSKCQQVGRLEKISHQVTLKISE